MEKRKALGTIHEPKFNGQAGAEPVSEALNATSGTSYKRYFSSS